MVKPSFNDFYGEDKIQHAYYTKSCMKGHESEKLHVFDIIPHISSVPDSAFC